MLEKALAALPRATAEPPSPQPAVKGDAGALERRIYDVELRQDRQEQARLAASEQLLQRVHSLEAAREGFESSRVDAERRLLDRVYRLEKALESPGLER